MEEAAMIITTYRSAAAGSASSLSSRDGSVEPAVKSDSDSKLGDTCSPGLHGGASDSRGSSDSSDLDTNALPMLTPQLASAGWGQPLPQPRASPAFVGASDCHHDELAVITVTTASATDGHSSATAAVAANTGIEGFDAAATAYFASASARQRAADRFSVTVTAATLDSADALDAGDDDNGDGASAASGSAGSGGSIAGRTSTCFSLVRSFDLPSQRCSLAETRSSAQSSGEEIASKSKAWHELGEAGCGLPGTSAAQDAAVPTRCLLTRSGPSTSSSPEGTAVSDHQRSSRSTGAAIRHRHFDEVMTVVAAPAGKASQAALGQLVPQSSCPVPSLDGAPLRTDGRDDEAECLPLEDLVVTVPQVPSNATAAAALETDRPPAVASWQLSRSVCHTDDGTSRARAHHDDHSTAGGLMSPSAAGISAAVAVIAGEEALPVTSRSLSPSAIAFVAVHLAAVSPKPVTHGNLTAAASDAAVHPPDSQAGKGEPVSMRCSHWHDGGSAGSERDALADLLGSLAISGHSSSCAIAAGGNDISKFSSS